MGDPSKLARKGDPDTSHMGAQSFDQERDKILALDALARWPGLTARELEEQFRDGGLDGKIRKRLNDLKQDGVAHKEEKRQCAITGRVAYTWYPGPPEYEEGEEEHGHHT